jgi:hypothetical protein
MLAVLALPTAGCGGISAGQSISPASFFLPGLLKNDTPTNVPVMPSEISKEFASAK